MDQTEQRRCIFEPIADLWALVVWLYVVVATIVVGVPAIVSLVVDRRARFMHWLAWLWGRSILWVSGVRVEVEGAEHADLSSPKIIMSNHQSMFDIWTVVGYLPRTIRFVAKKEMARVPIVGQALAGGGHVLIDRKNIRQAMASYDKAARQIRSGTSIVVFVEGTRSPDGRLLPFKKGGFMLALAAGVPIVPLTIIGGSRVLPTKSWRMRPGPMRAVFHEPIDPTQYSIETKENLMAAVRKAIASSLEQPAVPSRRR